MQGQAHTDCIHFHGVSVISLSLSPYPPSLSPSLSLLEARPRGESMAGGREHGPGRGESEAGRPAKPGTP